MAGEYEDEDSYGGGYTGQSPLAVMAMGEQFTTPEALEYARKILKRTVDPAQDPLDGTDYMTRVKQNAETARNALIKARERIAAQEYGNQELWLAAAAGFGSPTKTGSLGENLGLVAGNLIEPMRKRREFNQGRDKQLLDLDLGLAGVDENVLNAQLELMKLRQDRDTKQSVEALKIMGRRVGANQEIPKRAREAVDREYAKDYVEFVQTGASDAAKALEELGMARDNLRGYYIDEEGQKRRVKGGKKNNLTGPFVGTMSNIPWIGKTVQDVVFPESSDVQETVEYTVQRSLRPILGSQFTKEEGERLIARVYNPRLPEEVNAERLDRLIKQLERAYQAKIAAAEYFEEFNTLNGFKGKKSWSVDDFMPEADSDEDVQYEAPSGYLPSVEELPELDYESIVPAGEEMSKGGKVGNLKGLYGRIYRRYWDIQMRLFDPKNLTDQDKSTLKEERDRLASQLNQLRENDPTGDNDYARGGRVRYAEGGEVEGDRVRHEMPDGRFITAPAGVPYERVLQRYSQASGQSFGRKQAAQAPQLGPVAAQEPVDEGGGGFEFDVPTAIELGGSAIGHGLLGAAGGRLGMKTAHGLADLVPGHRASSAENRILHGLENEGLTPSDWIKHVMRGQRLGVPVTGMDLGGVEIRGLGEAAMRPDIPETRQVYQDTVDRQAGSRARVDDQINKALKPDDYFAKEKKLRTELRKNAKPVYDELKKKYPYLKSESLMQLMNTPSGKKAVKEAVKSIRDRPGATLGKTDAMGMITKPSIEFLDEVKDQLDDMINKEENSSGEYKATKRGRRLRELRNALRNEVDLLTTDPKTKVSAYKEARAQYAGDLEIQDALRFGRHDFLKMPAKEVAESIKDMNFTERDALRTGVAQALFERTGKTGRRVNPADKVIDSADMQEKLKLLFDKPKEYEIFKEAMDMEMKLFDDSKSTISKGKSSLSKPQDPNKSFSKKVAKEAPTLGITSPIQWALRIFRRKPELGKKEAAEILRTLRMKDPAELKKLEARLTPKVGRVAARKGRVGKAGMLGAAIGAAVPFAKKYFDDEGEEGEIVEEEE